MEIFCHIYPPQTLHSPNSSHTTNTIGEAAHGVSTLFGDQRNGPVRTFAEQDAAALWIYGDCTSSSHPT